MKELPKIYDPKAVEDEIYKLWEKSGYFNPDNLSGEPYSIMMPPPNVTGVLHLGHALENSLMDAMARYQRMQGKKVLLLPGTDHAAVATQAKVEKMLVEQGMKNPREQLGREKLLQKIREFSEQSKATILSQIKKMGTSCDWSRLAYTFDEKRSQAVNEVFVKMYGDGLIYRGYRVINWSVKGQSTCSDDELVHVERTAKLYTFKYSQDFPISIATTRPETKLGDTAVAVNPHDKRYKKYIGQTFTLEVGAEKPLEIKIIADENVEMDFGTGALGVTPAHSAVDFEMYEKQKATGNPIDIIEVIGKDGCMTTKAGAAYVGLTVEKAREKFVAWLKENNLIEKEEEITQSVGTSDRFGDVVEALPMTQWFIDVNKKISDKGKSLKQLMHDAVAFGHNGDPAQKVKITPERFEKTYFTWIENLRDWCISRQIWWGHQIPVW
jgi:valyl-tRNA synthetase